MRVFIAGVTGVLGCRVASLLVREGHTVVGLSRSGNGADELRATGVVVLVGDVYDRDRLIDMMRAHPVAVVVNLVTSLPDDASDLDAHRTANARIRRVGTEHLLAGAAAAGVDHIVTQSVAWSIPGDGGRAVQAMEEAVLAVEGTVVRYGQFYGPGTYYPDTPPDPPRIEVDDAARRTLAALTVRGEILTVVDDGGSVSG